jgi:vacuolar-type H+-ATPase subunit H
MKKTITTLCLISLLVSCKPETKEKLNDAKEAVGVEIKETIDSAKIKAETALDSTKIKIESKMDTIVSKGAQKVEEAAQEVKKSIKK